MNGQISSQPSIVGAHSRVIRGASQPAIINEWSFLIWLGFCRRSESVTSAPLSSFLGVSGGEGIATGKRTQMQTLIHEHTHNPTLCVDFQQGQHKVIWRLQWFEFLCSGVQRSHPGSVILL